MLNVLSKIFTVSTSLKNTHSICLPIDLNISVFGIIEIFTMSMRYNFSLSSKFESKFDNSIRGGSTRKIPSYFVHNDARQSSFEVEQRILILENCDGINQASK